MNEGQQYHVLVANLTDCAVFLLDTKGCMTSWNAGVGRMLGYAESEWIGKPFDLVFTEEDRAAGVAEEEFRKAQSNGQSTDVGWRVGKDGGRLWVEGTLAALRDHAGALTGYSKIMRDATERKRREGQLQDAAVYADAVINTIREPLLVLDRELRVRSANRAFYQTFRLQKEETEDKPFAELGNGEWHVPQLLALLQETLPKGRTIEAFELDLDSPSLGPKRLVLNARKLWREGNHMELTLLAIEDVTERQQAAQALREGEERWRSLFESMAESFFVGEMIYDETGAACDFRFLQVNSAFERGPGVPHAPGKTGREAVPAIQDELIQRYARVVLTGEPAHFEVHVSASGERWYQARAQRTGPGRFCVLFLDITYRRRVEKQLLDTQRQQAALLASAEKIRDLKEIDEIVCAAMETAGLTLHIDLAGLGSVDSSGSCLTITNCWSSWRISKLEGVYRLADYAEQMQSRLERGESIAISDTFCDPLTANKREHWEAIHIRASLSIPFFRNERLAALLFFQSMEAREWTESDLMFTRKLADQLWFAMERTRVLHELKESEEFSRSILTSSPDCVKVLDLNGCLVAINEEGLRLMEIDDMVAHLHQPWVEFWGSEKQTAAQALARAQHGETSRFEGWCPTAKGSLKCWEVVVSPVWDAAGKPVRILSISRDVTERKRSEEERERLTEKLKHSLREIQQHEEQLRRLLTEKETLLKEVHHRVKNNLQVVSSLLRMQGSLLQDQGARDALRESQQRVLSMALIHERLYSGKRMDEVDFSEYAKLLVSDLFHSYQGRSAQVASRFELQPISLDIDQAIPCGLILNELLTNALKYAYPDGRSGEIVVGLEENPPGQVSLKVSDHGVGLPPGLDWKNSRSMGLPIVELLAKQLGGGLSVSSQGGTAFTVSFPKEPAEARLAERAKA